MQFSTTLSGIFSVLVLLLPLTLAGCASTGNQTKSGTMQGRTYSSVDQSFLITVPQSSTPVQKTDEKRGEMHLADFFFAPTGQTGHLIYSIEFEALPSGTEEKFLSGWEKHVQEYLNGNFGKYGRYQLRDQQRIRLSGGQQASLFVAQGNHNSSDKPKGVIYGCAVRFKRNFAVMYVLRTEPVLSGPTDSLPGMADFRSFANSLRVKE